MLMPALCPYCNSNKHAYASYPFIPVSRRALCLEVLGDAYLQFCMGVSLKSPGIWNTILASQGDAR